MAFNQRQSLNEPSLVERVFAFLQDNRGDLLRPVALVIAQTNKLEECDQVQSALDAKKDNAFALSNFVGIDESNGSIVRWQLLTVQPNSTCVDGECPSRSFPLCSSLGVCGRLFEGSRVGLRAALAHIIAQVPQERRQTLSAALVQLERDPLEKVPFRCVEVYASTRTFAQDLQKEQIDANGQTNLQDRLVEDQKPAANKNAEKPNNKPCNTCNGANNVLTKTKDALVCEAQRRQRQQRMALVGFGLLFLIVAIVAVVFAVKKSKTRAAHEDAARKLDELYNIATSRSRET